LASLNPFRWSRPRTFEKAIADMREEAAKKEPRAIVVKIPCGFSTPEKFFDSPERAIEYIESEDPKRHKEAEPKVQKEEERVAREAGELKDKEDAERIAQEEQVRLQKEEAERKEVERKVQAEAERVAREAAELKVKEDGDRAGKEEAERIVQEQQELLMTELENAKLGSCARDIVSAGVCSVEDLRRLSLDRVKSILRKPIQQRKLWDLVEAQNSLRTEHTEPEVFPEARSSGAAVSHAADAILELPGQMSGTPSTSIMREKRVAIPFGRYR